MHPIVYAFLPNFRLLVSVETLLLTSMWILLKFLALRFMYADLRNHLRPHPRRIFSLSHTVLNFSESSDVVYSDQCKDVGNVIKKPCCTGS